MAVRTVYRGALGATRKEQTHVTCPCGAILSAEVHRCIDVSAHPDLAARLGGRDRAQPLDTVICPECGESSPIHGSLVYHDPERQLFVLVLPASERHRELAARADLLLQLDRDPAAVPRYVRDFDVVFGIGGLRELLQRHADARARAEREAESAETAARKAEDQERELARLESERADLQARLADQQARLTDLEQTHAEAARRQQEREQAFEREREAFRRHEQESIRRVEELEQHLRELDRRAAQYTSADQHPPRAEHDTAEVRTLAPAPADGDKTQLVSNPLIAHTLAAGSASASASASTSISASTPPSAAVPTDPAEPPESAHHARTAEAANPFGLFDDQVDDQADADITPPVETTRLSAEVSQVTELDPNDAIEFMDGEVVVADVPVTTPERPHASLEPWIQSGEPTAIFLDSAGTVRLAMTASSRQLGSLSTRLDVRVQLHRMPSFPVVVVAVGAPEAFATETSPLSPFCVPMNVNDPKHEQVLSALARQFTLHLDLYDPSYHLQRRLLVTANLEDNVRYVLEHAHEHLDSIAPRERSLGQAIARWAHRDTDRFGWQHEERGEFREDKLTDLTSAQTVRRALAIANRFSKPEREEYLFLLRGYPVVAWNRQRRDVLARAIELGIWMGNRLAPIAVEEGLASSYEDLIERMRANFARIQESRPPAYDLDPDAASDNWAALTTEAEELRRTPDKVGDSTRTRGRGKARKPRSTPIVSSAAQHVSGTIRENTRSSKAAGAVRNMSADELMSRLRDDKRRVAAAIELARRREARAVDAIMETVTHLNRNEAVRVLGAMPSFGDAATQALVQGLAHSKGFIRQGCALALSIIKNETALEALSDQVISEPTAIWREMARGLGSVGPSAIMPLVSRLSKNDRGGHERVAWALAHIAARGGKRQVGQLASGRDSLAASVAKNALELTGHAKRDDLQVRGANTPKEQTVNRAFSRSFFQALEASAPMVDPVATVDLAGELSAPAMLLDEADLLETAEYPGEDPEEMLDESDLIPT